MSTKKQQPKDGSPQIVVITGLSGSGMSSATNAFEDLGYFCVDNLPTTMLPTFARVITSGTGDQGIERAAIVIDIRERTFLAQFGKQLTDLRKSGVDVYVLFLEASDDVLQHRFSETRRPHPADKGRGLLHAIRAERAAMARVRNEADQIIDTSEHTVHTLRSNLLVLLLLEISQIKSGTSLRVHRARLRGWGELHAGNGQQLHRLSGSCTLSLSRGQGSI